MDSPVFREHCFLLYFRCFWTAVTAFFTYHSPWWKQEWESTRELYEDIKANFLISTTDSWDEYFSYLDEDRYTVFMLSDETGEKTAYVKNSGEKIFNRTGDIISGKLPGSMKRYRVVNNEEERSIEINGKERAEEAGDVNIAVYDSVTRDVFDVSHSDESGKIIHD